jgi:ribonuclease III
MSGSFANHSENAGEFAFWVCAASPTQPKSDSSYFLEALGEYCAIFYHIRWSVCLNQVTIGPKLILEHSDRQPLDPVRRLALPEFREALMNHAPDGVLEETPAGLATRLNLPFKNLLLLTRALTHRSYINEHPEALEDNERLEFLGDAVLDFITGAWLYNHFPEKAEGDLTRLRSALVCTEQLAEFARALDLGPAMRLGHGEDQAGGRQRDVLLCATFEALIGALYIQNDISEVQRFIHPMLEAVSEQFLFQVDLQDPKSRLQEWSQSQKIGIPRYVTLQASGPDHERLFEVEVHINGKTYGCGSGRSKQTAARNAAQATLEMIENSEI